MDRNIVLGLLEKLLKIRQVEEKIVELYSEQEMRCPTHLCIGQEAVASGVSQALTKDDIVFSTHRSHGHYIAKGGDIKSMIAEIYGKATGCSGGRGGSMHLIDKSVNFLGSTSIVGGTIPLAVGSAFSSKMQNLQNIAVAFFGDGATEEGVFHESLNFAKLFNLPILFICENNFYAVNTPIKDRQPPRKIVDLANAHSIEATQVDGNDVIKVYEVAKEYVKKIRSGEGPKMIEFLTYRWRQHCGMDYDHPKCRSEQEVLSWKAKCPNTQFINKLIFDGTLTEIELAQMQDKIRQEINAAFEFAKSSPFPDKETLSNNIYSEN